MPADVNISNDQVLAALAELMRPAMQKAIQPPSIQSIYKHTTPSGTPATPYLHGPGGLFGVSGLEQDVFHSRIQPRGLLSVLPMRPSRTTNPLFAYITGFLGESGSNPTGPCDDGPTAGALKNCIQTAQFGRYTYTTRELEVNRVGQQTDRGEFFDLRVINDPLAAQMATWFGGMLSGQNQILAGQEMLARMIELGVAFQNKLVRQVYIGNPANNSATPGGYAEFPGLDILIGVNKVDALTDADCDALNSDIKDFNYGLIGNASPDIVEFVTYLYRYLQRNAEGMNFGETRWVLTMRRDLFFELTAVWPCSYLTYRCSFRVSDGTQVNNVSAADQVAMRDAMRTGNYLLINGEQVPVVLDDGILEETEGDVAAINQGEYASDIYFIPMTVRGGMQVTYLEHLDYTMALQDVRSNARYQTDFWSDGGAFLHHRKPPTNWCAQVLSKIEPRIILRTPQLAGRITNVRYRPMQHTRDALPTDPYFVDGGQSTARPGPSLWSDWNL